MIIVDEQLPIVARVLGQYADVVCVDGRSIDRAFLERVQATALFIRTVTHVSNDLIAGTDVRFIASASAGIDHVDDDLRCGSGVMVVHAPGCNAQAVAEYVVAWLDHLQVPHESTIGIVGFGNVGSLVARYTRAMGMTVLVNDPPLAELGHVFPSAARHADLNDLLRASDVVSLHVPFTETGLHPTRGLIDAERLSMLKNGAILMNTSRGGIVDESALVGHVSSGRLRAVLDVYENEPSVSQKVIEALRYCTPHIAGYTQQAKANASRMVLEAYRRWSGLDIEIPELSQLVGRTMSSGESDAVILQHPFRQLWLSDPSIETFNSSRRLTPLRSEHLRPPTWEELHVLRD
jgi:erythronate-4-phosphate dehydrogenase